MNSKATIRVLSEADVLDYRAIRMFALRESSDAFGAVYAVEAARPIGQHRERLRTSHVLGAYHGAEIVGVIGLKQEEGLKDRHRGFLWGLFVKPALRGQGIGHALIAALLEAARGVVEQVTLTVVADNFAAIALYKDFGFVQYGLAPKALKGPDGYADEVLMVRFIDA